MLKGNNFEPQTLYLLKPPFKMDIGIFSDKPKKKKKSESQIPAEKYLRDVSQQNKIKNKTHRKKNTKIQEYTVNSKK